MSPQIPLSGSIGVPGDIPLLGYTQIAITSGTNYTLSGQEWAAGYINVTGNQSVINSVIFPATNIGQSWCVANNTSGDFAIHLVSSAGGKTIPLMPGEKILITIDPSGQVGTNGFFLSDANGNSIQVNNNLSGISEFIYTDSAGNSVAITNDSEDGQSALVFYSSSNTGDVSIVNDGKDGIDHYVPIDGFHAFWGYNPTGSPWSVSLTADPNHSGSPNVMLQSSGSFFIKTSSSEYLFTAPTFTDVTADREQGTTYQNLSGQNMEVAITIELTSATVYGFDAYKGITSPSVAIFLTGSGTSATGSTTKIPIVFTIPPYYYYQFACGAGTITQWVETTY